MGVSLLPSVPRVALTAAQPVFLAPLLDVLAGFTDRVAVEDCTTDVVLLTAAASVQVANTPRAAMRFETARMMLSRGSPPTVQKHK